MDNLPGNGTAWGGEETRRNSRGAKSISTREIIETRGSLDTKYVALKPGLRASRKVCVTVWDSIERGRGGRKGGIKFYRDTRG